MRLKYGSIHRFFICLLTIAFINTNLTAQQSGNDSWPIITRRGDQLYEGEKIFRFFGLAAPNIQQNETQIREDRTNRFPDEFEIRDLLSGIQRIGGRATRTFSLSIFHPDDKGMPVYIPSRRTYNEDAFRCLDLIIALCHEYDVRLIIPIIASQSFIGIRGVDEFAALAGKPGGSFWTDEEVKSDYRHLLDFMLNRKNTVNGIIYKNDPAILAWQFGNEFGSYAGDRKLSYDYWTPIITAWCLEMASYIKKIDPRHLVMEAGGGNRNAFIDDKNIDIISDHLYEYWNKLGGQPWVLAPIAHASREECKGKKALIIDEFGLAGTDNLKELMKTIREEGLTGGLLWSIRSRRRDGGWYYHNEGGTQVNSFHVPGFADGFQYEETRVLDLLRNEAYQIRGMKIPPIMKPGPAPLLIREGEGFTWRGSAGASGYLIERAASPDGPWQIIGADLHDSVISDVAGFENTPKAAWPLVLYYDETAPAGIKQFYRIKGVNAGGETEYSNVVEIPAR
jgi:mannan endo-1,4-beta-mannosidase